MSKFFDYGDEPREVSTNISKEEKWYHIWGTDTTLDRPNGMKISFWLWANSEDRVRKICGGKGVVNITKIKQETPSFDE